MQNTFIESAVEVLRAANRPLSFSDLRLKMPDPRPGYIELERQVLIRADLFNINASGEAELVEGAEEEAKKSSKGFK